MRIVLSTWGSLGDLHPLIPVALGLRSRGHEVVFVTNASHEERITGLGFGFRSIRPHVAADDKRMIAYLLDLKRGPERMLREVIFPALREQYDDLRSGCEGADLLVSAELVYAAPLVAETTGIRWATHVLAPLSFFSAGDPPIVPPYPGLARFYGLGLGTLIKGFGKVVTRNWIAPIHALRTDLGLPRGPHPIFEGKFSPKLTLAMFSPLLGRPQRDWPSHTVQTGFTFYDGGEAELPDDVERFLSAGEPPVVFTLGSSAVVDARGFFHQSIEAARRLGIRALVVAGDQRPTEGLPDRVHVTGYAPYSRVFPRASIIVHQGGVGTAAQALRAGKPTIVVPWAFDQPDNASRLEKLGTSVTIARARYDATAAAAALRRAMLFSGRAEEVAQVVRSEDGARAACEALLA